MAYARFAPECDLYVLEHCEGGYVCVECVLLPGEPHLAPKKMLDHIGEHYGAGHKVPMKLLSVFGILSDGLPVPHVDPVLTEMIAMARRDKAKIASWDADVPDDLRLDMGTINEIISDPEVEKVITNGIAAEVAPRFGSMDNA